MRKGILILLLFSSFFAVLGAAAGYGLVRWKRHAGPAAGELPVTAEARTDETAAAPSGAAPSAGSAVGAPMPPAPAVAAVASVASPTAPPVAAPVPRAVPVAPEGPFDSFSPEDAYGVSAWNIDRTTGGRVAQVRVAGSGTTRLGERPLKTSDVIELSGWAGDGTLGLTFSHVLFEVCGKVVGAAPVDEARPDVAELMHPNLEIAGWSARLAVAHLPRCEQPVLKAFATGNPVYLYPLTGDHPLPLPDAGEPAPEVAGAPTVKPDDLPPLDWRRISVVPTGAYLRRCGSTDCETVGTLRGGQHEALVMDTVDGWSLLVADEQAGWMSEKVFRTIEKLPPATAEAGVEAGSG